MPDKDLLNELSNAVVGWHMPSVDEQLSQMKETLNRYDERFKEQQERWFSDKSAFRRNLAARIFERSTVCCKLDGQVVVHVDDVRTTTLMILRAVDTFIETLEDSERSKYRH